MQADRPGGDDPVAPPPPPAGLARLVRERVADAELAALLWIMVEARTPVVVVGEPGSGLTAVIDALAGALPAGSRLHPVAPDDSFGWLPEAAALGWRGSPREDGTGDPPMDARTGVLVVRDLADAAAGGPAGDRARVVVRALALGYGMLATMTGGGLESALDRLNAPDVGTDEDERSRLGVVLAMADPVLDRGPRIAVAHYVRPVALDTHGHVQRLPPAALATWSPTEDRWDHFAWGVLDDLAGRAERTPRDLEREQARRASALRG